MCVVSRYPDTHTPKKNNTPKPQLIGRQYSTSMLYVASGPVTRSKKALPPTKLMSSAQIVYFAASTTKRNEIKFVPSVRMVKLIHVHSKVRLFVCSFAYIKKNSSNGILFE